MHKQIFVNLAVKDLSKSKAFFKSLGYSFNPQFTNNAAACLVLGENIFAMLTTEEFLSTFTKKPIADAHATTETILALSVNSREEVDAIIEKGVSAGGKEYRDADDHGWMYLRVLEDLDGHQWEFGYMDFANAPANPPQT
ncbi:MAG: hypothetical protein JWM20_68 [Patescibacteria group bacterium]|nr:hypothetical protein [Patescibacteria group bacterium]